MEETEKSTIGENEEEESLEEKEAKAYLVEKYYFNQHGYIPRYIFASIFLASSVFLIVMFLIYLRVQPWVSVILFLVPGIAFMVISILMFRKATRIRRRRMIAASRMREYESKHPEATMPHVITVNGKQETTSGADELLKWKKLLDDGAITQEEYDAKKKQILNL